MYDRTVKPIPARPSEGLRYRIETLIGITGVKMAKYRDSWSESILAIFTIVWRPHVLSLLIFEVRKLHRHSHRGLHAKLKYNRVRYSVSVLEST